MDRTTDNLDGLVETQNKLFMKWEALSFGLDLKTEAGDELHYVETYYLPQKSKGGESTFLHFLTLDRYEFSLKGRNEDIESSGDMKVEKIGLTAQNLIFDLI